MLENNFDVGKSPIGISKLILPGTNYKWGVKDKTTSNIFKFLITVFW